MYELIKVGERTYYIDCPAKIGLYVCDNGEVYLIDSGNDKEAGKKIIRILEENAWTCKAVINTHSNADHVGGNNLLQTRLSCPVYANGAEKAFIEYPFLEPSFLYGGYPCHELKNKFLMAQKSECKSVWELELPQGFELIPLAGHFFDMIGLKTPDGVWFLADCISGEHILEKYHVSFIYDVENYLKTLDFVESLKGNYFVPAHAPATENIKPLVALNRKKVQEILEFLCEICNQPQGFEEILKKLFDRYKLILDMNQYVLVGSTIRSYLSYLHDFGKLEICFSENRMIWKKI